MLKRRIPQVLEEGPSRRRSPRERWHFILLFCVASFVIGSFGGAVLVVGFQRSKVQTTMVAPNGRIVAHVGNQIEGELTVTTSVAN